jgi:hypothetical protein
VIVNRFEKSDQAGRVAVDEKLAPAMGWMALDAIDRLKAAQANKLPTSRQEARIDSHLLDDDVHELTVADMAAARLVRSLRQGGAANDRLSRIPAEDIVPVGGTDLRKPTPEAPFDDDSEVANDNSGRMLFLVTLLLVVLGGYAYSVLTENERSAIEVTPPDDASSRIVMLDLAR